VSLAEPDQEASLVELVDYLRILRKRWLIIIVLTLFGISASASATILMTPQYRATTQVFVYVPTTGTVGELAQGGSFAQNQVRSYAEAVSTPRVLDDVVTRLGLGETAEQLGESVTAQAPLNTVNIEIAVVRESPTEAADIANATTSSFRAVISDITQGQVSVSVLRQASVPATPISPNVPLNLALGLLSGLAIGIGIAVLREVLDTRIHGQRDVEAVNTAPIIGGIAFDPNAIKRPLIVQEDPHSPRAEAFRTLRTNLQFLDIEPGARSFVVTSAVPNEGKTTTAANLAIALADSGARVVIVDADLRRPKLATYLGIEGAVGLTDVLIRQAQLDDVLQSWGRRGLTVLPSGTVPPNPSELLGSRAMQSLVRALEQKFDVVLIDTPPLLPVTDAAVVSKTTKGTLLITAAGRTHRGELRAAIEALENVDAHISGIVLTMLPTKGPDAYGYGRYGYGAYGYGGYGYGRDGYTAERRGRRKVAKAQRVART
jgi:polysaccharide biosynthesis transport protein